MTILQGTYVFGSIELYSNMVLNISSGAILKASNDQSLYPVQDPLPSYCEARDKIAASKAQTFRAFIYAEDVTNVEVTGKGIVDGQGELWWTLSKEELPWERPRLMQFKYASNIKLNNLGTSLNNNY